MSSAIPDPKPSILLQTESKRLEVFVSDNDFVTYDLTRYDNETRVIPQTDKASLSSSVPSFHALGLLHMEKHCGMTEQRQQQKQQQQPGQDSWTVLQEAAPQTSVADCCCSFSDGTILDPWHPVDGSVGDGGGTCCIHGQTNERPMITVVPASAAAAATASFRQELQRARHCAEALQKDGELLQAICQQLEQDFYSMVQERDSWKERSLQQEDTIQHLMDHSNQLEEFLDWTEKNQNWSSFGSVSSSLRTIPGQQQPHLNTICISGDDSSDFSSSCSSNALVAVASSMHSTQPILLPDHSATFLVNSDHANENKMQLQHRLTQADQNVKDNDPVTTTTATSATTTVAASDSSSSSRFILESFLHELWPF
jgi:hypothetical protein